MRPLAPLKKKRRTLSRVPFVRLRCRLPCTLEQLRIRNPLAEPGESFRRPLPSQLVCVGEKRLVGAQCCEILEQKSELTTVAEYARGEFLDGSVFVEKLRSSPRTDPGKPGISIRRIANESQVVGYQRGDDTELLPHQLRRPDVARLPVDLHDSLVANTLGEVLVRCPDADLLDRCVTGRDRCRRSKSIVGLELYHRPYCHSHCGKSVLQRMELGEQSTVNALPGLVARPESVPEGFDDMIGRDSNVRRPRLDHLQNRVENSDRRRVRRVDSLVEPSLTVEMPEELVSSVDEVNYHRDSRRFL